MSIQKKSLISTLKTTKKANVAAAEGGKKEVSLRRGANVRPAGAMHLKAGSSATLKAGVKPTLKAVGGVNLKKLPNFKAMPTKA